MIKTEPLYTKEDIKHDALVMSAIKKISLEKATYFARVKRGRESISLARGFEETVDQHASLPSTDTPDSILYLAICEELTKRGLDATISAFSKAYIRAI